jgi:mannan endo-1,4-beta-mannosidase
VIRPTTLIGQERGPRPVPDLKDLQAGREWPRSLVVKSLLLFLAIAFGLVVSPGAVSVESTSANALAMKPFHLRPPTTTTSVSPSPSTSTAQVPTTPAGLPVLDPTTTTTTTTSIRPLTTTIANSSNIEASGTQLFLDGSVYRFLGVNAYEAATEWGVNEGCGADLSDTELNQMFASLPPNSLVRFSAFQGTMGSNVYTHQLDWGPIDRVFAAATAYHQRLIPVIGSQAGGCDGGDWKGLSWYQGGFMDVASPPIYTNDTEPTLLSYWAYLQDIVNRYKNSPALGMWEPMAEGEASTCPVQFQGPNCYGHQTCPDEVAAAAAIRYFYDTVGAEIHALDPNHLVESGLLGGGQCGTQGSDYQYVSASPGIDVLSYHDYYGAVPIGGDQWNGLAVRFAQAAALGKPIIGGEVGLDADGSAGCMSVATRNADFASKIQAQVSAGSSGILAWDWVPNPAETCNYDIGPTDPLMQPGGAIG